MHGYLHRWLWAVEGHIAILYIITMEVRKFNFFFKATENEEFEKNADNDKPVRICDIKAKKIFKKNLPNNGSQCNKYTKKYENYKFQIQFKSKNENVLVGNLKQWTSDPRCGVLGREATQDLLKAFRAELVHLGFKDSTLLDYI